MPNTWGSAEHPHPSCRDPVTPPEPTRFPQPRNGSDPDHAGTRLCLGKACRHHLRRGQACGNRGPRPPPHPPRSHPRLPFWAGLWIQDPKAGESAAVTPPCERPFLHPRVLRPEALDTPAPGQRGAGSQPSPPRAARAPGHVGPGHGRLPRNGDGLCASFQALLKRRPHPRGLSRCLPIRRCPGTQKSARGSAAAAERCLGHPGPAAGTSVNNQKGPGRFHYGPARRAVPGAPVGILLRGERRSTYARGSL